MMVTNKLFSSFILAFLGLTGYVNAVINIDALKNMNANDVGKELEAYQRKFEDNEPAVEFAVALDVEMSKHAAALLAPGDVTPLVKFYNDVCALTLDDGVQCQNVVSRFLKNCAAVPYECTRIAPIPVLKHGRNVVINSFDHVQLTTSLMLYNQVVLAHGNIAKRTFKKIGARVGGFFKKLFGKEHRNDYVDVGEKVFVDLILDKLQSGVTLRGFEGVDNEMADTVPSEYVLGVGIESIVSAYVLFYRMLTVNITNKFNTLEMVKNKLGYRIYILYFKNMKQIGKALTAAARAIFTGMDFMAISRLIKELYYKLPEYLAGYGPAIDDHQIGLMAKIFINTVHGAAIKVADIDVTQVELNPNVVEVVNNVCVRAGTVLPIPKCWRLWGRAKQIKKSVDDYSYTMLKAIVEADKRERLHGRGNIFKRGWHHVKRFFNKLRPNRGGKVEEVPVAEGQGDAQGEEAEQ